MRASGGRAAVLWSAVGGKDAVLSAEVDAGLGDERGEPSYQVERLEEHVGTAIQVKGF